MSVQSALDFIGRLRNEAQLRRDLATARDTLTYADLVSWGVREGHHFDEDDLGQAYCLDWRIRCSRLIQ